MLRILFLSHFFHLGCSGGCHISTQELWISEWSFSSWSPIFLRLFSPDCSVLGCLGCAKLIVEDALLQNRKRSWACFSTFTDLQPVPFDVIIFAEYCNTEVSGSECCVHKCSCKQHLVFVDAASCRKTIVCLVSPFVGFFIPVFNEVWNVLGQDNEP